ncbi:MAG: flagellar export protein FliJ [Burkholderiaceae bacterium]|nr:flagellar export protein FliJ [Burkholderiaceae bacterium]
MDPANLNMLIELARAAHDAAAARHAQCTEACAQAQRQLELLHGYQREYGRRAQDTLSHGIDAAAQGNLRAFLQRLQTALAEQTREVARREQQRAAAAADLAQARARLARLEKLAQRRARAVQQRQARREQRALDELARRGQDSRFGPQGLALKGW